MPDTGAPWNIPYAAPADLVRDWPDLSEDVANAVAAGLSAAGNAGIGSNVVSTTKLDAFSTSSGTFVAVTGLSATITPSSATAKVLVLVTINNGQGNFNTRYNLMRGATAISQSTTPTFTTQFHDAGGTVTFSSAFSFLDSPATTSATAYSIEMATTGTAYVNRSVAASDRTGTSTITVIEVAA
jgi:hypothetical protein